VSQPADFTIDHDTELQQWATDACLKSSQLTERALDWAATNIWQHEAIVAQIVAVYVTSDAFDTWATDVADGADTA